ncbi:MAG: 5'-methylthioadenosine/adenosylhomocysteine nucleosidase [Campylobacter sp.]|nr:5'-methylthioadenosine/adenosylhomocysteine nucleosidase [Campylobacter sp.]
MRVAILSAMEEELFPILESLENYEKISYANNIYYKSSLAGHELILAYSKIGKVNAALTTTILLERFKAEVLLFSGVAGSLSNEFKIKDLFYATSLAQHDLDITAFGHPHGFVPGGSIFVKTDTNLNTLAKKIAQSLGINLKSGVIATGDQFVCSKAQKEFIAKTFKADAVEMEGASVAVVCEAFRVPFFVLRTISDNSNEEADIHFDEFLDYSSKISAKFTVEMVKNL